MTWDEYFYKICAVVSKRSHCLSRQFGAILIRDNSILATGYNGPARGMTHCMEICPRRVRGYASGKGLHLCPAVHAEANCIANAARHGVCTHGASLYINGVHPCKDCISLIVNAGITEVVCTPGFYDTLSIEIAHDVGLVVRNYVNPIDKGGKD